MIRQADNKWKAEVSTIRRRRVLPQSVCVAEQFGEKVSGSYVLFAVKGSRAVKIGAKADIECDCRGFGGGWRRPTV